MAILSKDEAQQLLKKVLSYSKAEECEAFLPGSDGGNIRYARNSVSTAGEISQHTLAVSSTFGKKTGVATIDEFDDASLEKVVRRAEELAQLAPENPEHMPLLGPQDFPEAITYVPATAAVTPDSRAEAVGKSIQVTKDAGLQAAGYLENTTGFTALMNSKGLFAFNKSTDVVFSVTTRNEEGTGSGYAARGYHDVSKLDTYTATKIAATKPPTSTAVADAGRRMSMPDDPSPPTRHAPHASATIPATVPVTAGRLACRVPNAAAVTSTAAGATSAQRG